MFNKLQSFANKHQKMKKVMAVCFALMIMCISCLTCFATDGTSSETVDTVKAGVTTLFGDLTEVFSFANIISFLGIAIGSCALLTLGWFGLRKVISMIQKALKKGKVSA